jgi:hypothetical protein
VSWEQWLAIRQQDKAYRDYWAAQPPRSCPNDGTPLQISPPAAESTLFCPFDGWQYPADYDATTMAGI